MPETFTSKSRESGYFKVSDGHSLYYEFYGSPSGIPLIYLHGGPGAGFDDSAKRFFDPKKFNVLLFEQRGSGRSKPFASLKANNTDKLVDDINSLLDFAGFKKALFFGGSWGSTLALVYAIRHPERVTALLLRGIWLANSRAIKSYMQIVPGLFYPEAYERFISLVPKAKQHDCPAYYSRKMQKGTKAERQKYAYEYSRFELSMLRLSVSEQDIERLLKHFSYKSMSPIEAHYVAKKAFLPENYILKNSHKLKSIPLSIVHGRYDMICPPWQAYELHKRVPNSRLALVTAGHTSGEPEIEKKLLEELAHFAKQLKPRRKKSSAKT